MKRSSLTKEKENLTTKAKNKRRKEQNSDK
jgi:hypothetical protein